MSITPILLYSTNSGLLTGFCKGISFMFCVRETMLPSRITSLFSPDFLNTTSSTAISLTLLRTTPLREYLILFIVLAPNILTAKTKSILSLSK